MADPSEPKALRSGLLTTLESVTKLSAALAAFGYLSLRTHLNTVGAGSSANLGLERYLMELPEILGRIFVASLPLGAVAALAGLAHSIYRRFRQPAPNQFSARLHRFAATSAAPLTMTLLLIVTGWITLVLETPGQTVPVDLAVGDLTKKPGRADPSGFIILLYLVAGLSLAYCWLKRHSEERGSASSLWLLPQVLLCLVALQLPILYGLGGHSSIYLKIRLAAPSEGKTAPPETVCGLLILETPTDLHIWTAKGTLGVIRAIARSEVKGFTTGEASNLWEIVDMARQNKSQALCPAGAP
jgi:hypothetical protein